MKAGELEGSAEVFVAESMLSVVVSEGVWLASVAGGFAWDAGSMCSCRSQWGLWCFLVSGGEFWVDFRSVGGGVEVYGRGNEMSEVLERGMEVKDFGMQLRGGGLERLHNV